MIIPAVFKTGCPRFLSRIGILVLLLLACSYGGCAVAQQLSCQALADRINGATADCCEGGAKAALFKEQCFIRILPGTVLASKVSLRDSPWLVVLLEDSSDDTHQALKLQPFSIDATGELISIPVSDYLSDGEPETDKPSAIAGQPGYQDSVFLELNGKATVAGLTVDRTELQPESNGCYLPGVSFYGKVSRGENVAIGFADSGIPACDEHYTMVSGLPVPDKKIRQVPNKKGSSGITVGKNEYILR